MRDLDEREPTEESVAGRVAAWGLVGLAALGIVVVAGFGRRLVVTRHAQAHARTALVNLLEQAETWRGKEGRYPAPGTDPKSLGAADPVPGPVPYRLVIVEGDKGHFAAWAEGNLDADAALDRWRVRNGELPEHLVDDSIR